MPARRMLPSVLVGLALLPVLTPRLIDRYAHRTAAFRTKWLLGILFGLGALATWAGSEAVLPAYIAGMLFSRVIGSDHTFGVCFSDTASVPLCELSFELRFSCSSRTFSRNSPTNVCQEGRLSRFSRKQSYRGRSEVEPLGGAR